MPSERMFSMPRNRIAANCEQCVSTQAGAMRQPMRFVWWTSRITARGFGRCLSVEWGTGRNLSHGLGAQRHTSQHRIDAFDQVVAMPTALGTIVVNTEEYGGSMRCVIGVDAAVKSKRSSLDIRNRYAIIANKYANNQRPRYSCHSTLVRRVDDRLFERHNQ